MTCPSLDSSPKCSPIAISSAPLRKLIFVGYLNTPSPPLPHKNHQLLAVLAAQQLPPARATTSSYMANLRGTCTSASWPRPSWQFWLIPVPQTPFEVMKREYLAPAKMQLAGQTLSQCGQQQIFRANRPSCPSLLLPHPNTFEPHSAKLWSFPALICLTPFKTTSNPPEAAGLPRPSSP